MKTFRDQKFAPPINSDEKSHQTKQVVPPPGDPMVKDNADNWPGAKPDSFVRNSRTYFPAAPKGVGTTKRR